MVDNDIFRLEAENSDFRLELKQRVWIPAKYSILCNFDHYSTI